MTVAIDVGNGSLKIASVEDGRVGPVERLPIDPAPEPLALAERIAEIALHGAPGAGVALVSVVPRLTELVREAARVTGVPLLVADATTIPLPVLVPHPARVGADRLLGAWGASLQHGAPLIVVDLGTATTIDAVDGSGAFAGGAILPGMDLGLAALARGTALLPEVQLAHPRAAIGEDTLAAIRSGVVLGHLGAIRELVTRIAAELDTGGRQPVVVATGGITQAAWARDALLLPSPAGQPPIVDAVDPELLLRSLGVLAARAPAAAG